MFKETADIQTADMLKLPVPEAHYHSVVLKPSETQKEMVASLSERAERVRNKMVDSSVDNMLLITNDGRKLALDQRLMNDMLPDSETSKVGACAESVFDIWQHRVNHSLVKSQFPSVIGYLEHIVDVWLDKPCPDFLSPLRKGSYHLSLHLARLGLNIVVIDFWHGEL